jgi:hypothetical protein
MTDIMSKQYIDNVNPSAKYQKSLNNEYRKRELMKITAENQAILKRIQTRQPVYNHLQWENDHKKNEEYCRNISEYPKSAPAATHLMQNLDDDDGYYEYDNTLDHQQDIEEHEYSHNNHEPDETFEVHVVDNSNHPARLDESLDYDNMNAVDHEAEKENHIESFNHVPEKRVATPKAANAKTEHTTPRVVAPEPVKEEQPVKVEEKPAAVETKPEVKTETPRQEAPKEEIKKEEPKPAVAETKIEAPKEEPKHEEHEEEYADFVFDDHHEEHHEAPKQEEKQPEPALNESMEHFEDFHEEAFEDFHE